MRDADGLFESRGVADVRVLHSKMGSEIEQKKKDLRLMVGERYRHLIEAADSVAHMKEASLSLQRLFDGISQLTPSSSAKPVKATPNPAYPGAVRIKLLVDTPEQIWNAIESNAHLRAARLWQAANSINRSLQSENLADNFHIPLTFPLVQRQWDSIAHFREKILSKAKDALKNPFLPEQAIAESICAIMLLERMTQRQVLSVFLATRTQSLAEMSNFKNLVKTSPTIPDLLFRISSVIQTTIIQTANLFFPVDAAAHPPLVEAMVLELSKPLSLTAQDAASSLAPVAASNSIYSLYAEKSNMHVIFRHLPLPIQNHVPVFNMGSSASPGFVDQQYVMQTMDAWIQEIVSDVNVGVVDVLRHVSGGAQLAAIRETLIKDLQKLEKSLDAEVGLKSPAKDANWDSAAAHPDLKKADWNRLCVHLIGRKFSLWDDVFRVLFKEVSVGAIERSFMELSNQVETVLLPLMQSCQSIDSKDRDVSTFIWTAPPKSKQQHASNPAPAVKPSQKNPSAKIDLGCRVQTPSILKITDTFEERLNEIKADIVPLINPKYFEKQRRPSLSPSKASFPDVVADDAERDVAGFTTSFQENYLKALDNYQERLQKLLHSVSGSGTPESLDQIMFIARAAKALAIKVKSLSAPVLFVQEDGGNASASASIVARLRERNMNRTESVSLVGLESSQALLMKVHVSATKLWIDKIGIDFEKSLSVGLKNEDWTTGSKFLGVWEAISLEAKDESGETQKDQLKFPVHVSSFVIQALLAVASQSNKYNGFLLEKPCLKLLLQEMAQRIVASYRRFLDSVLPELNASDKAYVQILFDYEYLVKVVDGCWVYDPEQGADSPIAKDTKVPSLAVLALIRSLIDPIDLAIASAHLSANVDRFYSRTSVLLGSLLALNDRPTEMKKNPSMHEMHNVIAVANQPPRFTMLLTSLPGASLPASSNARMRSSLSSLALPNGELNPAPRRTRPSRARIQISANATANHAASGAKDGAGAGASGGAGAGAYAIGAGVLSGVVGLVASQQGSLFGGATSVFGAFMGGGGGGGGAAAGTASGAGISGRVSGDASATKVNGNGSPYRRG
ncbi:Golgi transport complex subunit 1 [Chytriomyces hyalinus]|nr:Golgi transport complex subunit 1 [Chytriomyces hyalinus]